MSSIISGLRVYAGNYNVVKTEKFDNDDLSMISHSTVVDTQFIDDTTGKPKQSVCMYLKNGGQVYMPFSNQSKTFATGTEVNVADAVVVTLHRDGNDDIQRIQF